MVDRCITVYTCKTYLDQTAASSIYTENRGNRIIKIEMYVLNVFDYYWQIALLIIATTNWIKVLQTKIY